MNYDSEKLKKATILKVALRTYGVNVVDEPTGAGESIKEDINGLYQISDGADAGVNLRPNEVTLHKNITTKLVYRPDSSFSLRKEGDSFYIFSEHSNDPLSEVEFSKRPFHYALDTTNGTPMKYIGQVMGRDCLAIAIDKQCSYFTKGDFCKYCNITATNKKGGLPRFSSLEDIAELIRTSGNRYRFFDLTGGTFEDRDEECRTYTQIGNVIRDNLSRRKKFGGPFSLSPPKDLDLLEGLFETNVDVVSFNMDVWSDEALKEVCPGKFKIGKKHYEDSLEKARELWGDGNSVIQFLAGPWESSQSLLGGVEHFLDRGILANITTFYPSPKSTLRRTHSKDLGELLELYINYGELIRASGLFPNSRRSILTSESANRSSISNEVAKGFLTRDNFDKEEDLKNLIG
jgi:hypothetical protein